MIKTYFKYLFVSSIVCVAIVVVLVTQPLFRVPETGTAPPVDASTLKAHVRMLSEEMHPRCYDRPENLERVVRYIEGHFAAAGGRVNRQTFPDDEREYHNVIASFGPEEGPVIVVGAHYDSYGENYREPALYTPGADDNASGVAGLLALAELLGRQPPERRVQLVAYCLEEPPFFGTKRMGSAVHASALHDVGDVVTAMISLEMIGYFSDTENSQTYPAAVMSLIYPDQGNFIGVVGRFQDISLTRAVKAAMRGASDLPVRSISAVPLIPGIDFSDHRNYWRYDYTAVMITDTAFYRNFAYHTEGDIADILDYERMAKVVQGVFAAINALATDK